MSALPASSAPILDDSVGSPAPESFARNRYFDRTHGIEAVKLLPGEYHVSTTNILQVTVLGSCVAACIRDTRLRIGGMNHFMLPDRDSSGPVSSAARYGTFAMETLITHLIKLGARHEHLEAKVFGGGNVLAGLTQANVGHRNARFVVDYLKTERIRIAASDLADVHPRKVYFFPATGRVLVKRLRTLNDDIVAQRERDYGRRLVGTPVSGDIELFN